MLLHEVLRMTSERIWWIQCSWKRRGHQRNGFLVTQQSGACLPRIQGSQVVVGEQVVEKSGCEKNHHDGEEEEEGAGVGLGGRDGKGVELVVDLKKVAMKSLPEQIERKVGPGADIRLQMMALFLQWSQMSWM